MAPISSPAPSITLTVNESALTLGTGANVQIAGGVVGGDNTAGVQHVDDRRRIRSRRHGPIQSRQAGERSCRHLGNIHNRAGEVVHWWSFTWIGFNEASTPSTALIELSGTGEMRLGVAGATANTARGLGCGIDRHDIYDG